MFTPATFLCLVLAVSGSSATVNSLTETDTSSSDAADEGEAEDEPSESEQLAAALASLGSWSREAKNRAGGGSHVRRRADDPDEASLDRLPQPSEQLTPRLLLYTRHHASRSVLLPPDAMAAAAFLRPGTPLKLIVHGFGSSCRRLWAREMKRSLLAAQDADVICVDWEDGAGLPNYVQAAANCRLVGHYVARFLDEVASRGPPAPQHIHLIGFSLGAHVAGFAGQQVPNVSRITGLDPAGPLFEGYSDQDRLDPSDAVFVDVIHSNGDRLLKGGLGAFQPMGHKDFYPNGGKAQAGCNNFFLGALSDLFGRSRSEEDGRSLCNHRRAYKFFAESVDPACRLTAFKCKDFQKFLRGQCFSCGDVGDRCANMGLYADANEGRGKFYLLTREDEPLCANQLKIQVQVTSSHPSTYGLMEVILFGPGELNESFPITSESEEIPGGKTLVKMVVAHPALLFVGRVHLRYAAYKGWIYRGGDHLALDRILITDSFGRSFSLCSSGMVLHNGIPLVLRLLPGECQLDPAIADPNSLTPPADTNEVDPLDQFGPNEMPPPFFPPPPPPPVFWVENMMPEVLSLPATNFSYHMAYPSHWNRGGGGNLARVHLGGSNNSLLLLMGDPRASNGMPMAAPPPPQEVGRTMQLEPPATHPYLLARAMAFPNPTFVAPFGLSPPHRVRARSRSSTSSMRGTYGARSLVTFDPPMPPNHLPLNNVNLNPNLAAVYWPLNEDAVAVAAEGQDRLHQK